LRLQDKEMTRLKDKRRLETLRQDTTIKFIVSSIKSNSFNLVSF